jgi:hypothetical protein
LEHHRRYRRRRHRRLCRLCRRLCRLRLRLMYGDIAGVMILFYIIKLDSILPSLVESSGREDGMHLSSPPATAHC